MVFCSFEKWVFLHIKEVIIYLLEPHPNILFLNFSIHHTFVLNFETCMWHALKYCHICERIWLQDRRYTSLRRHEK